MLVPGEQPKQSKDKMSSCCQRTGEIDFQVNVGITLLYVALFSLVLDKNPRVFYVKIQDFFRHKIIVIDDNATLFNSF